MIDFKVDEGKCIECGLCAQECPVGIIQLKPKPFIREAKEKLCMECQHCLAVCPTAAVSILGKKPEDSVSAKGEFPGVEAMGRLIKTRRSIRKYKKENIEKETIYNLINTAAYAPTGHNSNSVRFAVVDNLEDMDKVRNSVYDSIKAISESGKLSANYTFMASYQKVWENKGVDIIFRGAPHMIISSAPKSNTSPVADSIVALTYFELLANSMGIGTLWNGMIKWSIEDIDPTLKLELGIPEDHVIGYIMLFGKSAVKYARGIQNGEAQVKRIKL